MIVFFFLLRKAGAIFLTRGQTRGLWWGQGLQVCNLRRSM